MSDDRALRRALQIERATRKLFAVRLRSLMAPDAYSEFTRFCREKVYAGGIETTEADRPQSEGTL
jgi:hypothetical protein